jgi:lipopolysaccharide/colanic/teichoic acid biosynthesis glycosyltransferase
LGVADSQPYLRHRRLKRVMDIVLALGVLIVSMPVMLCLLIAVLVSTALRKADRGPLLYRERRISHGKEFDILKLRVLTVAALQRMEREGTHAHPLENDPTCLTWAGRVLIKPGYLDELPQLFNILKGDMSLVGPRPWPVHMVDWQVARGVIYRQHVRAGWAGLAQLEKRIGGNMSVPQSETADLEYIGRLRSWSSGALLLTDLMILLKTIRVLLQRQGLRY